MIPPNARLIERHEPSYYANRQFDEFPHIRAIKHLWCNNWYDGELEGVAEANGENLYYFFHDARGDTGRIFLLFRLSSEQWEHETLKHDQEEKPYAAAGYYDAEERLYSFSETQIVGYCTDCDW